MTEDAAERRARLAKLLRERTAARTGPLTPAQRRLWFLEQLDPGQPTYHIPTVMRLGGRVDLDALRRALDQLVRRHEALRTVIDGGGADPQQRVLPRLDLELPVLDLAAASDADLDRHIHDEVQRGFDLTRGPLVRAAVMRVAPDLAFFVLTVHHLVADGWSLSLLLRELDLLYRAAAQGEPSPLPDPPLQYLDYARWLERQLTGEPFARLLGFWRRTLDGAPPRLALPTDHPRPAVPSLGGALHPFEVAPSDVDRLRRLVQAGDATLFMGLLAAFGALLHRRSGDAELVIGSPVANRPRLEMEGIVGLCANVLPLRVDLCGDPGFAELLGRTRERVLAALLHQDLPFERLVEELAPVRDLGRNPVFQVLFTLQNLPRGRRPPRTGDRAPTRDATPIVGTGRAQFDLTLSINEAGGALLCSFEYATDLFAADTVARMAGELVELIRGACDDPARPISRLPLLAADERAAVIAAAGGEAGPARAAHALIADRAARTPEAPALESAAGTLTFAALEREVAAWTARLRARGVGLETPVVVCGERSPELIIGALAVLRAGGTYVPIDPELPAARAAALLAEVRPALILSPRALAERWRDGAVPWLALDDPEPVPAAAAAPAAPVEPPAAAAAYVIFTSGTTGRPRGVAVTHGGLANHVRALQALHPLGPDDAFLQLTSIGFDASLLELCAPLAAGARLVVPPPGIQRDPRAIVDAIARHRVTAIQVVPSLLGPILDEPGLDRCRRLRRIYCGGETMPVELQRRAAARTDAELLNLYGPTETAIDATGWRCGREPERRTVPIGTAIPGARVLVLDAHLEPVPVGVAGELYVGGDGVARGYLGDPALTAARFVPDPFGPPGARMYRTGDRARRRADGALEYVGRGDGQVKVRGHRVELGEIEAALRRHPAVDAAAAALTAAEPPRLVAAVTARAPLEPEELARHLAGLLPAAVVPGTIRVVDALPLGATGKVDRRALAALIDAVPAAPSEPPRPGDETALAAIWQAVLGVAAVGRDDNFFELGGHSLLATQLVARIRDHFRLELPMRELFTTPTVAGLAAWLDAARRAAAERAAADDAPTPPPPATLARWHAGLDACVAPPPAAGPLATHPLALSAALTAEVHALAAGARVRTDAVLAAALALTARRLAGGPVAVAAPVPHADPPALVPIAAAAPGGATALALLHAIDAALADAARSPGLAAALRERLPRIQLARAAPVTPPPPDADVAVILPPDGAALHGAVHARGDAAAWAAALLTALDHLVAAPARTIDELIADPP